MNARRIWVAGHKGMVGSAITWQLEKRGDICSRSIAASSTFATK